MQFGILGHAGCSTDFPELGGGTSSVRGECYNEVECVLRRGRFREYCGPPAVTGVCCVFATDRCDATIEQVRRRRSRAGRDNI